MAMKFECPKCGKEILITVEFLKIGDIAKCRNCGAKVVIPADATEIHEESESEKTEAPKSPRYIEEKRGCFRKRAMIILAILGIIALFLGLGFLGNLKYTIQLKKNAGLRFLPIGYVDSYKYELACTDGLLVEYQVWWEDVNTSRTGEVSGVMKAEVIYSNRKSGDRGIDIGRAEQYEELCLTLGELFPGGILLLLGREFYVNNSGVYKEDDKGNRTYLVKLGKGNSWTIGDGSILTVISTNGEVEVPAGRFTNCLIIEEKKFSEGILTSTTTRYYAAGVGLVKSACISTGFIEAFVSWLARGPIQEPVHSTTELIDFSRKKF